MKRLLLLMLVAAVALSACSESRMEDAAEPRSGIILQLNLSESPVVQTRAQSAAETTLNNLWLFVFNSSGTLAQKCKARVIRNNVHTADVTIKEGSGLSFYACANVSAAEETKFDGLANGSATVADLKAITTDRSLLSAPGLPMSGQLLNQTITAATTKVNMTLTRSCSRVDVVASGIADFTLTGIEKLLKTAQNAPVFPGSSLVAAGSTTDAVPTNKTLGSIYLYENAIVAADEATAESKATAVIVKATYKGLEGFYKLRVKYGTPVKYDIGRNVIYSINITSVKAPGFATLAEAEASYPQNVDYSVTASDGYATDLVTSNGQYYLGVTNSEYAVYNSDALSDVAVVTVTHNAPSSITAGTVTATGTGLTVRTTAIPTSTQKQDIKVDMTAGFTSGTLTLRLGNLIKVVTIKKKPTVSMMGGFNADYAAASYVQGDLDEVPTWLMFSKDGSWGEQTQKVQNPSGGLWMFFLQNIGATKMPRSTGAYVTSADAKGRARIVAKQDGAIFQYLGGAPTGRIPSINPDAFTVNLKTDLPGWTIKAYDQYTNPIAITLSAKTGTPVRGTPADCSVLVTVPNNLGVERIVNVDFVAAEDPMMRSGITSVIQEAVPAVISLSLGGHSSLSYVGGQVSNTVTSTHYWNTICSVEGVTISPSSGPPGTNIPVVITYPLNKSLVQRTITVFFNANNGTYMAQAFFTGVQLEIPPGSYITRSVLAAAGWPSNSLPAVGLQVATRGKQILPGEPVVGNDPAITWKTSRTFTDGVEIVVDMVNSSLGRGKNNTDYMLASGASEHPAAWYCRQMGPGWYLPNVAELILICRNLSSLGYPYQFSTDRKPFYWTSTEANKEEAWAIDVDLFWTHILKDNNDACVRCVREL